jgi:hypothetical protein
LDSMLPWRVVGKMLCNQVTEQMTTIILGLEPLSTYHLVPGPPELDSLGCKSSRIRTPCHQPQDSEQVSLLVCFGDVETRND